jgi:hypothetical protein
MHQKFVAGVMMIVVMTTLSCKEINFFRVQPEMTEAQVIDRLGKPDRVERNPGKFIYGYKWRDKRDLLVFFNDRTSKVTTTGGRDY